MKKNSQKKVSKSAKSVAQPVSKYKCLYLSLFAVLIIAAVVALLIWGKGSSAGQAIAGLPCVDPDNTYNPNKLENVTSFNKNSALTKTSVLGKTDYCMSKTNTTVIEAYCLDKMKVALTPITCNTGSYCKDGACVKDVAKFCYYVDINGKQMPAGINHDVTLSPNGYYGIITQEGMFSNTCSPSPNLSTSASIWVRELCGNGYPFTSGVNVERYNPSGFTGWFNCNYGCIPNRCCHSINVSYTCSGGQSIGTIFTDCGTTINFSNSCHYGCSGGICLSGENNSTNSTNSSSSPSGSSSSSSSSGGGNATNGTISSGSSSSGGGYGNYTNTTGNYTGNSTY